MASLFARFVRNPQKYARLSFWRLIAFRARIALHAHALYAVPTLLRRILGARPLRVYVFPLPMGYFQWPEVYVAWKTFWKCNVIMTTAQPERAHLAIAWKPATSYTFDEERVANLERSMRVINARCTDIRKSTVDNAHEAALGYSLAIDPLTYDGKIVRKSEKNGAHDGCVLQGPLTSTEPGYVYQRFVSYPTPDGFAEWRTFIVARRLVAAYVSYRPADDRFAAKHLRAHHIPLNDAFTADEQMQIQRFCDRIGLDFGVLDVLRDAAGGRMYVSDCNNTPTGPSLLSLTIRDQLRIMHVVASEFEQEYLAPLRRRRATSVREARA